MKTKKLFYAILTSALLMSSLSSFCQYFSAGARVGMDFGSLSNFSKVKSDAEDVGEKVARNAHVGFQGGFFGCYNFNKILGVQAEFIFDRKGEKLTYTGTDHGDIITGTMNTSVTYMTIPILFKGGYDFGRFQVYGIFGPYIGIGLAGKLKYTENGTSVERSMKFTKYDATSSVDDGPYEHANRFDAGLTIGVQPGFKLGPGIIIMDLRYNFGFIDVQNYSPKPDNYYVRCTRSFGLSFGYVIPFGKK